MMLHSLYILGCIITERVKILDSLSAWIFFLTVLERHCSSIFFLIHFFFQIVKISFWSGNAWNTDVLTGCVRLQMNCNDLLQRRRPRWQHRAKRAAKRHRPLQTELLCQLAHMLSGQCIQHGFVAWVQTLDKTSSLRGREGGKVGDDVVFTLQPSGWKSEMKERWRRGRERWENQAQK